MVTGERVTVTLTGGAPWGFRLQGGGSFPLEVAKIRKKSHACDADLREGDTVVGINGIPMSGKTHQSAMELVEISTSQITMEVIRSKGSSAANRPLDPQRQPRIIPMVDGQDQSGPGLVSTARAEFSTTEGNTRRNVRTDEFVVNSPGGKRITKTVTEERVTRYQDSLPSRSSGQSGLSPAQSSSSLYGQSTPGLSASTSQTSVVSGEHVSRSPNRSPMMWKPPSLSPISDRSNTLQEKPSSNTYQLNIHVSPARKTSSPSPVPKPVNITKDAKPAPANKHSKENVDPVVMSEQAKWEARQGPSSVPKFKLDNFGSNTFPRSMSKKWEPVERVEDPRYPMFDVYKPSWKAPQEPAPVQSTQAQPPPVAPKPVPSTPPIGMVHDEHAQMHRSTAMHYPGMIKPPSMNYEILQLKPAPPPPPMPPALGPPTAPKPKKFRPGYASTPKHRSHEEPEHHHPDHLPVFAPRVYFAPEDDSGFPGSPTRSEPILMGDEHSDISSLGAAAKKRKGDNESESVETTDSDSEEKLFSDSAFYDEPSHRYPTIDEQMSMCKKIAQSLTSAANRRAKGARMFLKRKRKSNKWVHDELSRFSCSEYSSEPGDVADLTDLDSELFIGEGGSRPLFSFRIPNIAGQRNEPTKMSLSKEEFERLRLGSTKCDHHNVSPDMCFSIAADLHSNTRNRGAKLFHRRQQRVEKFVIDESNAAKPLSPPTKLEQILQNPMAVPQKTPWNAAAQGNVQGAFTNQFAGPVPTVPKHILEPQCDVKLLEGGNYNRKIKGWAPSSQPHSQQSDAFQTEQTNYTDVLEEDPRHARASRTDDFVQSTVDYHSQEQMSQSQFGDYNRKVKGWPGANKQQLPSHLNEQDIYKGPQNYFPVPRHDL